VAGDSINVSADSQARFDAGAQAWSDYNQQPLGRIRREVTWRNLAPYLPTVKDTGPVPRVLDAGGGSGELALRLVQHGYRVWLLDYSPAMLEQARLAARDLAPQARDLLTLCQMAVDDVPHEFCAGSFDSITCHTLVEYLPHPPDSLGILAGLLCDGGVLSVSFVNRHAEVLRQAWSRTDPAGALATISSGVFCASLFDLPGKAYTAGQVTTWLAELGLHVEALCGVRAFADWMPRQRLHDPAFFDDLLRLERLASRQSPYRDIARYQQIVARKAPGAISQP
jgi:S-adenosylmethionine-dependent methyltransferase